jgi:quercetin dioxygenase-like cupin family protein
MDLQGKSLDQPDEVKEFENGRVEIVHLESGMTVGRFRLRPGWRWSENVKPLAGTESCQATHTGYVISGRIHLRTDDGQEREFGAGDAYAIPPGHDAWIVGDEDYVGIDVTGAGAFGAQR